VQFANDNPSPMTDRLCLWWKLLAMIAALNQTVVERK
jgi:hypothetical protein